MKFELRLNSFLPASNLHLCFLLWRCVPSEWLAVPPGGLDLLSPIIDPRTGQETVVWKLSLAARDALGVGPRFLSLQPQQGLGTTWLQIHLETPMWGAFSFSV